MFVTDDVRYWRVAACCSICMHDFAGSRQTEVKVPTHGVMVRTISLFMDAAQFAQFV